jgi:nucleoside-diphosphate-sugar epimerase
VKVIVFGATGMIGQGVLRECLLDPAVEGVLVVTRNTTSQTHPKLREIVHADFADLSAIEGELTDYDACFYCLGVSSVGMSEADYTRVTYDYAMAAGRVLARHNPTMTFVFISGGGTDSSEKARPRTRSSPYRSRRRSCSGPR